MRFFWALSAILLLPISQAAAQSESRWTATSSTSIAVTGNVAFNGDTLRFSNGRTLKLIPLGTRTGSWAPFSPSSEGFLYRLTTPSDPILRNKNTLCGEPVTFIVFSISAPRSVSMSVYTGRDEPAGGMGNDFCALYNYESDVTAQVLSHALTVSSAASPAARTQPPAQQPQLAQASTQTPAPSTTSGAGTAPAPLSSFKDCDQCPEMVVLPPGRYMMGATAEDRRYTDAYSIAAESPRHEVRIGYSFAIGRHEVTVEQFAAYVAETGAKTGGECEIRTPDMGPNRNRYVGTLKPGAKHMPGLVYLIDADFRRPGAQVTERHPATCLSRREARAYLEWLSKKSGKKYRFPTEAEWEYAVRAESTTPFHYGRGPNELCRYGNFADRNSPFHAKMMAQCAQNPSPGMSMPIGSYQPNKWGLHDMIGNAFEFIEDCATPNYNGAPADGSPHWPASGEKGCAAFATRGYFFESPGQGLRSAARCSASDWDSRSNGLTIRVAVSLTDGAWDRKR